MEIIKKERLRFSEKEDQALMLTINLLNGIVKVAEDPALRHLACAASIGLNELICTYGEEEV